MRTRTQLSIALVLAAGVIVAVFLASRMRADDATGIERATGASASTAGRALAQLDDVELGGADPRDVPAATGDVRRAAELSIDPAPKSTRSAAIGSPILVRVRDEAGAPILGAHVKSILDLTVPPGRRIVESPTDRDGTVTLEGSDVSIGWLKIAPPDGDHMHAGAERKFLASQREQVVTLRTRHWLELTVVDGEGKPVTHLDNLVVSPKAPSSVDRSPSSSTGVYVVETTAESKTVWMRSWRHGIGEHAFDPVQPATMSARVVLDRAAVVRATTKRDGQSIAGVRVALVARSGVDCGTLNQLFGGGQWGWDEFVLGEQTSDGDGRVEFAVDDFRSKLVLVAEAVDVGICERPVHLSQRGDSEEIDLALTRGAEIELRVVDARGDPVPRADLWLRGTAGVSRQVTADDRGRHRATDLPPGRYHTSAGRSRFGWESGVHAVARLEQAAECVVAIEPRCQLSLELPPGMRDARVNFYWMDCPPAQLATETVGRSKLRFSSDEVGRHVVCVRAGRDFVQLLDLDLKPGENAVVLREEIRDCRLEVSLRPSRDGSNELYFRSTPRDGHEVYCGLHPAVPSGERPQERNQECFAAEVPLGSGEIVRLTRHGDAEVLLRDVRTTRGSTTRVVIDEPFGRAPR